MININELTLYYIQVTFQPELQKVVYTSFSVLEMFGLKFYEDKYTELIQRDDTIDTENKRDNFLFKLKQDVSKILSEHGITLDTDADITLNDVNEIAHFLYIVQHLEDYSDVAYRLHALDTPKNIVTDLIQSLTLMSKSRLLDIISDVSPNLVASMKQYIADKEDSLDNVESLDVKHRKYVNMFFTFTNQTECLGKTFYENGYTNVTLEELTNLISYNLAERLDKQILTNLPQVALDVLSILIITKDNYTLPLIKFSKSNHLFTSQLEHVTKLQGTILAMLNDFTMYLEATNQKELVQWRG